MDDYQPLDLSQWCNAGPLVLGGGPEVRFGRQTFRGLPFQVGPGGDGGETANCFIALDGSMDEVTIPINLNAHRVIVAHRLLESRLPQGRAPGVQVAEYVFRTSSEAERVPIRERFEIGIVSDFRRISASARVRDVVARGDSISGLASEPVRAVPDQNSYLKPRYGWAWEEAVVGAPPG